MAKKIKKDFDKDKMYRKIMPSMEPEAGGVQEPHDEAEADEPEVGAQAVVEELPPDDEEEPQLHNLMEDMMRERLVRTINVLGACDCERCKMDIMAIALNALPAAYGVVWKNDAMYIKKLRAVYEVKVTAALIKAIQQVKSAPRHQVG